MAVQVRPVARQLMNRVGVHPNEEQRSNAKRQLFGSPNPGECSAMYREAEEKQKKNLERYVICGTEMCSAEMKLPARENISRDTISRCSSKINSKTRPKPYSSQKEMTDFFKSQKSVTINNRVSDVRSAEESTGLVPQRIQENVGIDSTTTVTTNESLSSLIHPREHEQSQQQIALHTMTTDHNTKIV